jgi:predicted transcriptional regulator
VDRLLNEENWFAAKMQVGIDQRSRGEFLEEEEMDARVARRMQACSDCAGRGLPPTISVQASNV